jgi:hypothetical protein
MPPSLHESQRTPRHHKALSWSGSFILLKVSGEFDAGLVVFCLGTFVTTSKKNDLQYFFLLNKRLCSLYNLAQRLGNSSSGSPTVLSLPGLLSISRTILARTNDLDLRSLRPLSQRDNLFERRTGITWLLKPRGYDRLWFRCQVWQRRQPILRKISLPRYPEHPLDGGH